MTNRNEIFCSIIIPSYNSKLTICKTLESLKNMQTEHPYEVIVVDSSSDETPEIIENKYPWVQLIHLEEQTYPGSARNLGLRHSTGSIVAFLDSDCTVITEWLNIIVDTHATHKMYAAVVGSIGNGTPRNLVGCASYLIEFNEWTPKTKKREINYILGGNVSYKKEIIMKHNLSYTDIFPSEDTIFAQDLIAKREKILFIPDLVVYHINNTSLCKVLKHQYVLGNASARARRDKGMIGNIISKYKILVLGVPLLRYIRAFIRLLKQDIVLLGTFLVISPIYLLAVFCWSIGYMGKDHFKPTKIKVQE
ncbi:MAG: glycosyltransferase family 2 protein [bacterium]